ncbi:hypothetical protein LMG7974_01930 [Campylobacter majalis]|uniref:Uncharacterized protein n=1 Tax=Campylobacter majalis TaxID=2790656 RepID=A0ABN7KCR3_9BACT|nr:hypothetical protein LMG7974_01930 [Campylobacter majalis]
MLLAFRFDDTISSFMVFVVVCFLDKKPFLLTVLVRSALLLIDEISMSLSAFRFMLSFAFRFAPTRFILVAYAFILLAFRLEAWFVVIVPLKVVSLPLILKLSLLWLVFIARLLFAFRFMSWSEFRIAPFIDISLFAFIARLWVEFKFDLVPSVVEV